jgi:hypothetical protein
LRICLIARNDQKEPAFDSGERHCLPGSFDAVKTLAEDLSAGGHQVHVILAGESPIEVSAGLVQYYAARATISTEFTGRFAVVAPTAHRLFAESLGIWEKFLELHKEEAFDLLDTTDFVVSSLMPGLSRIVPTVCSVQSDLFMFKKPPSLFERLLFEEQLVGMLERLSINLVDFVLVPTAPLAEKLHVEVKSSSTKTAICQGPDALSARENAYRTAIENHRKAGYRAPFSKPATDLAGAAVCIFKAYDQMIYDFLYQNSYRFRLYHWWHMWRSTPNLFTAKLKRVLNRSLPLSENK